MRIRNNGKRLEDYLSQIDIKLQRVVNKKIKKVQLR